MDNKTVITRRVNAEHRRLVDLFDHLDEKELKTIDGLLVEAARLRILCDESFEEILASGETELVKNAHGVRERQRDISKVYTQRTTAYSNIIKTISKLFPQQDEMPNDENEVFLNWLKG